MARKYGDARKFRSSNKKNEVAASFFCASLINLRLFVLSLPLYRMHKIAMVREKRKKAETQGQVWSSIPKAKSQTADYNGRTGGTGKLCALVFYLALFVHGRVAKLVFLRFLPGYGLLVVLLLLMPTVDGRMESGRARIGVVRFADWQLRKIRSYRLLC